MTEFTIGRIVFNCGGSIGRPVGLLNGLSQEKSALYSGLQSERSRNAAFEVGYDGRDQGNAFPRGWDVAGDGERNADDAIQMGQARSIIEINNRERQRRENNVFSADLHCSKFRICHGYILSLKSRFGRSLQAFVNAWRGVS